LSCKEVGSLLEGYLDGELDLVRSLEVERHLEDCSACREVYQSQMALKTAFKNGALYFEMPANLPKRLQTSLRQAKQVKRSTPTRLNPWLAAVAAVVAIAIVGWGIFLTFSGSSNANNDLLAQEVLGSHVRSLMADHLSDVVSSDQHTVKPWFDGKLDFAPVVIDLSAQGFPLVGGRLDYLDGRPVAALIYQRQKHFINLFSWPTPSGAEVQSKTTVLQGYQLISWSKAGMNYWAVSDLNYAELSEFVQIIQAKS
jgi:anti-sigma factor RsiW